LPTDQRTRPRQARAPLPLDAARRGRHSSGRGGRRAPAVRRQDELLFAHYQRHGDLAARTELIERYLPLARSVALRYKRRNEPIDDLMQVASLGLVKAIDRFEPDRGSSFSSYAVPTMLGELRRHFRDTGWALHVPREMQERILKVNTAVEHLSGELGCSPSPQQLAVELDLSVEEVLEAIEANAAHDTKSLDAELRADDHEHQTVADTVGETDGRFELIEGRVSIGGKLMALPERERSILYMRFVEDLPQSEIAQRLGISQMHVSRLMRRALERARILAGEE
jgi:RNA polymerase sigma-B factor